MSSLKLFGISVERLINLIGNAHVIIIVSLVLSVAIDFHGIGESKKIGLDVSATALMGHFIGFFVYQIFHLLVGRLLLNVDPTYYRFLAILEFFQAYFTILYFHNPFFIIYWKNSTHFLNIFMYTRYAYEYAVYGFLGVSALASLVLMCSKDSSNPPPTLPRDSKRVLGMSYKTCETVIYWLSFLSFIPTIAAILLDFQLIVNYPYINKPSNSQLIVGIYYAVIVVYQYGRFVSLLFPYLEEGKKGPLFWEILQLIISLAFFFNPYRETNKVIFEYFKYTTIVQTYAIPTLFFSLFFNCLVYFLLSSVGPAATEDLEESEEGLEEEEGSEEEDESGESDEDSDESEEKSEEYKVLDEEESSVKDEKHVHRNYWLNRKPFYEKR
ncbi:unnamed protein product [Caenorhabditis brenneri]